MARARYDELLAVAERWTIEAIRNPSRDGAALVAGWQAVYAAATHHFGWLGQVIPPVGHRLDAAPDPALANAAAAIGAAADLLASHTATTADLREDPAAVADARRHLAVLTLSAAYAARSALELPTTRYRGSTAARTLRRHLSRVRVDLAEIVRQGSPMGVIPPATLARLTTSLPSPGRDLPAVIGSTAARWSHAHQQHDHCGVVTRDLRATTAQQRTTNAMTAHLVGGLITTASEHQLPAERVTELPRLQAALYKADRALLAVEDQWRRYASSGFGPSNHPAVVTHQELAGALRTMVGADPDRSLARGVDLVPDRATAYGILTAVDELTQALADVAEQQAAIVARLADERALFINRDVSGRRMGRLDWIRLQDRTQAAPLIEALDHVVPLATEATRLARVAARTLDEIRPAAGALIPTVRPVDRDPAGHPDTDTVTGLPSAIAYASGLADESARAATSLEQLANVLREGGTGPQALMAIDAAREHLAAAGEAMRAAADDLRSSKSVADAYRTTDNEAGSRDFLTRE